MNSPTKTDIGVLARTAIDNRDSSLLFDCIEKGANPNDVSLYSVQKGYRDGLYFSIFPGLMDNYDEALIEAIKNNHTTIIDLLIDNHSYDHEKLLLTAIESNNTKIVDYILKKDDIANYNWNRIAVVAAKADNELVLLKALQQGVDNLRSIIRATNNKEMIFNCIRSGYIDFQDLVESIAYGREEELMTSLWTPGLFDRDYNPFDIQGDTIDLIFDCAKSGY